MPPKKKKAAKRKPAKKTPAIKKNKVPAKKITKKRAPQRPKTKRVKPQAKETKTTVIGKVTHYFPHVNAAVVKLKLPLKIGDTIHIKGHTTDIIETVTSIQINRTPITAAKKGDEIGLLVASRVRAGDKVYKASRITP